ncbi:hypothetical protein EJ05DRAFT_480629 [Pseudovirgaria hyperparasitica]|uniref:Uncharacterized protein n=1 Tax=Pseudovirgaria hyperparasitica TaxID=470096 RepID=A0A6A6VU23_9PEZI|nr:uncharacterized protein EJ05DRAFT_480629 [Pseudovirgaria hyperparasitica]KAF2753110.1 hypothetical protein EJ05DRAFT_480629 [Pseudovirgaria hyperparasitica]
MPKLQSVQGPGGPTRSVTSPAHKNPPGQSSPRKFYSAKSHTAHSQGSRDYIPIYTRSAPHSGSTPVTEAAGQPIDAPEQTSAWSSMWK